MYIYIWSYIAGTTNRFDSKQKTLNQCCFDDGPDAGSSLKQVWVNAKNSWLAASAESTNRVD